MAPYFTPGVAPTDTGAGVVAMEVPAGHVVRAVWVDDTLWFALGVRVALVVGRAAAFAVVADLASNRARPTRVGVAGIRYLWLRFEAATYEGITNVLRDACTDWRMVYDAAFGVVPAHTRAGVHALRP